MSLLPEFQASAPIKPMINVGACLDIPNGTYIVGAHGESLLNGGLGALTGIAGIGNNFKSTLMHYMFIRGMARMDGSFGSTYDTEVNIHEWHLRTFMENIEELEGENLIDAERWLITDKTIYHADEWFDKFKDSVTAKRKNQSKYMRQSPFLGRDGKQLEIIQPTFAQVDSMSEFMTQDVIKMQDDNSLGEAGGNMVSMRQGMQKNRFLMEAPALMGGSSTYMLMTAHIGNEFNMDPRNPAPKKLQHLTQGIKLKGVPEKFTFVMNCCYWCHSARPLINQTTKAPEYPRDSEDDLTGDTDLNTVNVKVLRSKSGPSGMTIELIVSQAEGVKPALTEFHNIKSSERFGLGGNDRNYYVIFAPHHKLSRTTVRGKTEEHGDLRRALNFTSEISQMHDLWHHFEDDFLPGAQDLYDSLIAKGYTWAQLLETREWWCLDNEQHHTPYLSSMDLIKMRWGTYHPYWMPLLPGMTKLEMPLDSNGRRGAVPWIYPINGMLRPGVPAPVGLTDVTAQHKPILPKAIKKSDTVISPAMNKALDEAKEKLETKLKELKEDK